MDKVFSINKLGVKRILFLVLVSGFLFSCEKPEERNNVVNNEDNGVKAIAVTLGSSHISCISVVLSGKVNLGKTTAGDIRIGIMYSKSAGVLPSTSTMIDAVEIGEKYDYNITITGLEPETTYYYRSYVSQAGEIAYGDTKSFTTKNVASLLETLDASHVSETQGTMNAKLDLTEVRYDSLEYGFYWGTTGREPSTEAKCSKLSESVYSYSLTGLSLATEYEYKAYVKVDNQMFYGETQSLKTQDIEAVLETLPATDVSETKATLNGKLSVSTTESLTKSAWFLYSKDKKTLSDLKSSGTKVTSTLESDGTYNKALSGLSLNTTYYFVACSKVYDKEFYGDVKSFKTTNLDDVVSIATNPASNVTFSGATLSGSLTVNTTESLSTSVWFLYSKDKKTLSDLKSSGTKVTSTLGSGGTYNKALTGLSSNTTYYYVACSKVYDKEFYGDVKSFKTTNLNDVVSIATNPASNVTFSGATLSGSLTVNTTESLSTSVWFLYSKDKKTLSDLKSSGTKAIGSLKSDGSFKGGATGFLDNTCYYFIAVAKVYDKEFYGSVRSFTTGSIPEAVDLGLSVKWRSWNLGASRPEEFGNYYAWGETKPKTEYSNRTYTWCNGSNTTFTKYNNNSTYGQVDNKTEYKDYNYEDDAARQMLGGKWRTPTDTEWKELRNSCIWVWTENYKGVKGYIVNADNGNSIFLPAAGYRYQFSRYGSDIGYYWSSSLNTDRSGCAWATEFGYDHVSKAYRGRVEGLSVRPVTK